MTNKTKLAEAYAAYLALKEEEVQCVETIKSGENAKIRLRKIRNNLDFPGELLKAENRYKELKFPLYDVDTYRTRRIVLVDKKWISLKTDGDVEITRFKRDTGEIENGRGDCETIDVNKALKIWGEREIYDLDALLPKSEKKELSKYTPAPWIIDGNLEDGDFSIFNGETGESVLEINFGMVNQANAELIASAPLLLEENEKQKEIIADLVEGLEAMLEQYDYFETDCISAHELSHRALAKANDFIKEVQ